MNPTESYTKSTEPTKSDDSKRAENSNSSSSKSDENRNDGFIFPHSSQRKLTVDEVTGLGGDVAQDAINEIYARHGYVFKTKQFRNTMRAGAGITKTTISAKATFQRLSRII